MTQTKTKPSLRARALALSQSTATIPALIIGVVSEAAALAVGFGVLTSVTQGAVVALSTTAVNAAGWIAHSFHTGKISPSGLQTYVGALVAQGAGLAVAFGAVSSNTASSATAISVSVLAAVVQVMQAVKSTQVVA